MRKPKRHNLYAVWVSISDRGSRYGVGIGKNIAVKKAGASDIEYDFK